MVTPSKTQINDDTRIIDITVGELRTLIQDIVQDAVEHIIFELEQQLPDPDEGKTLKPEIAAILQQNADNQNYNALISAEQVKRELEMDD